MSNKNAKTSIISFLISGVSFVLILVLIIYINDPLQIWHKSYKNSQTKSYTIRESARAFIRDYDFDSVIIGDSRSENTSAKMVSKLLNGKFFNLSIAGSNTQQKYIILKYLLKHKNIKQIVYLLDSEILDYRFYDEKETNSKDFDYLYNDNPIDDIKIYLNDKYIVCALNYFKKDSCTQYIINIDTPYMWENIENHFKRFGGFDVWLQNKDNVQIQGCFDRLLKTPLNINKTILDSKYKTDFDKYFENYLYSIIKENPKTKFYIVISPASELILASRLRNKDLSYQKYKYLLLSLVKASDKYDNIEIYAFDDDASIGKIKNFKDLSHYNTEISNYIINSIAQKKHLITSDNINNYIENTYNNSIKVNFEHYIKEIKKVKSL